MIRPSLRTLLGLGLVGTLGATQAQISETEIGETETVFTEEALAERWRLTMDEWAEYETLMEGPRGIWSPNLDPVTVLGIHAETDAERRRYAELLVMLEFERVEKELLFQRAYDEAAERLFPTLAPVNLVADQALQNPSALPGADRIAFVGSIEPGRCPSCQRELARLMRLHSSDDAPALDLFLADAADDEEIRAWARGNGVSREAVRSGRITLNHARGPLSPPVSNGPIEPRLMQRLAGRWLPMTSPR